VENEYSATHSRLQVFKHENIPNTNLASSAMASRSGQSSYDPYDLSSDDEEYLMPNTVSEMTPRQSDHAARSLTAARFYLNSPPKLPQNWGQIIPNLNDYHSDPMEICSAFWLPDITDRRQQQEELHLKYADLSNVAHDIFSNIAHTVGVGASFSLGRDVIGRRKSKTTGETLRENVLVRQFARANNRLLAGDDVVLDITRTDTDIEMKREAEESMLYWMAKIHKFLEM